MVEIALLAPQFQLSDGHRHVGLVTAVTIANRAHVMSEGVGFWEAFDAAALADCCDEMDQVALVLLLVPKAMVSDEVIIVETIGIGLL